MTIKLAPLVLLMLAAAMAACQSGPRCPAGATAMGAPPPKGEETWCQKTVNGVAVKDGPFAVYRISGGLMLQGDYVDGKQNGPWKMWYDNGVLHSIDTYKNGVEDGPHTSWYKNGHLDAKGQYKDGKKDGTWKRWSSDSDRNWEEVYKDGKRIS